MREENGTDLWSPRGAAARQSPKCLCWGCSDFTENGVRSFLGLAQGSVEARELSLQNGNVQEPCKLLHCTGLK